MTSTPLRASTLPPYNEKVVEEYYFLPKNKTNTGLIIGSIVGGALIIGGTYWVIKTKKELEETKRKLLTANAEKEELKTSLKNCQRDCIGTPPSNDNRPSSPRPTPPPTPTPPRSPDIPESPINNISNRVIRYKVDVKTRTVHKCIITTYKDGRVNEECEYVGKLSLTGFETDDEIKEKLNIFIKKIQEE